MWILGWFWDLGLIELAVLFYSAPLLLHGVHGCFLSGCVCFKVQGRKRLVLMRKDGAELMKDNERWRWTMGGRIGQNGCRIGKLLKEANKIWGAFGVALEEEKRSFFGRASRGLAPKSREWAERGRRDSFWLEEKNQEVKFRLGGYFGKISGSLEVREAEVWQSDRDSDDEKLCS